MSRHIGYYLFKIYVKSISESLMVRRRYTIGLENLPKEGEKYFIVCNHQNTANDPLNIIFALPSRYRVYVLARANVFEVKPLITKFLRWLGLLPAYRLDWEGVECMENNLKSFDLVADRVLEGNPVVVFPEAGHTQGHYSKTFTTGVIRMAFHAAERTGWQEDIKIVPTAHHYEDFFDIRTDFMWKIDRPISLKPYYEEFQHHPYTVMRTINHMMFDSIHSMMLDEGKEDYTTKEFLRNSSLNTTRSSADKLPQQLEKDKAFIDHLCESSNYREIIDKAETLRKAEAELGLDDSTISRAPGLCSTLLYAVIALLLLPAWIVSLWPHALCYKLPMRLLKTDIMFTNSYRYILSVLLLYPMSAVITLLVGTLCGYWLESLVWIALWMPLGCFAWWYWCIIRTLKQNIRYILHKENIADIISLRKALSQEL